MFRFFFSVAASAGAVGAGVTIGWVLPIASPHSIAEPPYDDCAPGFYRGSSGDCVPRPNQSPNNVTAICRDGSYSHAEHTTGALPSGARATSLLGDPS
jgi:hypothetical protein